MRRSDAALEAPLFHGGASGILGSSGLLGFQANPRPTWLQLDLARSRRLPRALVPFRNSPQAVVTFLTDKAFDLHEHRGMNSDRVFFVTTVTIQRLPIFRREANARLLIDTMAHYRDEGKFLLHEFVIMPDHIHALLTPSESISLERTMQFIKGGFSYRMDKRGSVWQASFTNHRVRDWEDYERCREYIRMNPVRARLVKHAEEYAFSSAAGCVRLDAVPPGLKPRFSGAAVAAL